MYKCKKCDSDFIFKQLPKGVGLVCSNCGSIPLDKVQKNTKDEDFDLSKAISKVEYAKKKGLNPSSITKMVHFGRVRVVELGKYEMIYDES